jgi:hypothetical protein
MNLASMDDEKFFRALLTEARRSNASFYPIDPEGLRAPMGGISVDTRPIEHLRELAENTDGLAIVDTNGLTVGMRKIAEDLNSFYLLRYYSTNTKFDGRFRSLRVRVRQPGVSVRARPGYHALPPGKTGAPANAPASTATEAGTTTVQAALSQLSRIPPSARFRVTAVAGPGPERSLWVVGELRSETSRPHEFSSGASAAIEAVANGASVSTATPLKAGQRSFVAKLQLPASASGFLDVRVRLAAEGGAPLTESTRVDLDDITLAPVMFRRGPTTGPQLVATPDPVFSRTERLRFEIPVGPGPQDGKPGSGRLLDRGGAVTQIPVVVGERTDAATGQRWITADASLAALSPADYVVEMVISKASGDVHVLTPIRVGR